MKSIIQTKKECYVCKSKNNLHEHHIFFGKNRKKSEEDGMKVYLCYAHHEGTDGVHGKNGSQLDKELKYIAERVWISNYGDIQKFIIRYGRNYLI